MLSLGFAQRDITPKHPMPLAGFGFRKGNFEDIHTPLKLSVFVFQQKELSFAFIHGDLLWWGSSIVERFEAHLKEIHPEMSFIFHASHTHFAPQVSFGFASGLGLPDPDYINGLLPLIKSALSEALENKEEVKIYRRDSKSLLPINRRCKNAEGLIEMQPNPQGSIDDSLNLITFENRKGVKAAWVCASCHPTCSGDNRVSAEFQTAAVRRFFPECGVFIQGFCGDARPRIIKEDKFYRGSLDKESEEQSRLFYEEIRQAFSLPKTEIEPGLCLRFSSISLPLAEEFPHKNRSSYIDEAEALGEWARHWSSCPVPAVQKVRSSFFSLGSGLVFLALDAEVVSEYALKLKKQFPALICLGYTNGMTAYIPTAAQLKEGGYEAYDSMFWFMRPAPFSPEAELLLLEHCSSLIQRG